MELPRVDGGGRNELSPFPHPQNEKVVAEVRRLSAGGRVRMPGPRKMLCSAAAIGWTASAAVLQLIEKSEAKNERAAWK
jgi:hypothetical protein